MSPAAHRNRRPELQIAGRRISLNVLMIASKAEPRLRFDRVAIGLIRRLQDSLSATVPNGRVAVVTVTAPIRQSSKTCVALEAGIRALIDARRSRWKAKICGNQIQVRVLKGGWSRTSRLIGFVHNPQPDPSLLFEVTQSLLDCIGTRTSGDDRWLIVSNQDGRAPFETIRQAYAALGAAAVFKRILLAEAGDAGVP